MKSSFERRKDKSKHHDIKPLYFVLEGGGAKGISHIAAWNVLESIVSPASRILTALPITLQQGATYQLKGIAGTSAGAIVAAFIAAGAHSEWLIDSEGRFPLCSTFGARHMVDLFGIVGWRRLKQFRFLLSYQPDFTRRLRPRALSGTRKDHISHLCGLLLALFGICVSMSCMYVVTQAVFGSFNMIPYFVIVCSLLNILIMLLSTRTARAFERRREKISKLHFDKIYHMMFDPVASFIGSLLISAPIFFFIVKPWIYTTFLYKERATINSILPYSICIVILISSLVNFVHRRIRGSVKITTIERHINSALQAIIRREPHWDTKTNSYEWIRKTSNFEHVKDLFARIDAADGEYIVTFADLFLFTGISLTVVTSDIVANAVTTFTSEANGSYSVARAVAASSAIPFAFSSIVEKNRIMVDGGVVSAIPAWVFRRHRTHDPDARIIAVEIKSSPTDQWLPFFWAARRNRFRYWQRAGLGWLSKLITTLWEPGASLLWPLRYVANIGSTAAFGGRVLELDASDRLDILSLSTSFDTLDFDKSSRDVKKEMDALIKQVIFNLSSILWIRADKFKQLCDGICAELEKYLITSGSHKIRIFWSELDGSAGAVRIKLTHNFDDEDMDGRLVLPYKSSMTGWAALTKKSKFGDKNVLKDMLHGRINRFRKHVKWRGMEWCWAIPFVDLGKANQPLAGVLTIEGNMSLDCFKPNFANEASDRSLSWIDPTTGRVRQDEHGPSAPKELTSPVMTLLEEYIVQQARTDFFVLKPSARLKPPVTATRPSGAVELYRPLGPKIFDRFGKR